MMMMMSGGNVSWTDETLHKRKATRIAQLPVRTLMSDSLFGFNKTVKVRVYTLYGSRINEYSVIMTRADAISRYPSIIAH